MPYDRRGHITRHLEQAKNDLERCQYALLKMREYYEEGNVRWADRYREHVNYINTIGKTIQTISDALDSFRDEMT